MCDAPSALYAAGTLSIVPFDAHLDVVIEGQGATRGARIRLSGSHLYVGERSIPLDGLWGINLRPSVLLIATRGCALAIRAEGSKLAPLAAELRRHGDRARRNVREAAKVGGETLAFHAPAAVTGSVGSDTVRGFPLVVAARRGLLLLRSRGAAVGFGWARVRQLRVTSGPFGPVALVAGDRVRLELVYLSGAHIEALRTLVRTKPAATRPPAVRAAGAATPAREPVRGSPPAAPQRDVPVAPDRSVSRRFRVPEFPLALKPSSTAEERGLYSAARALSGPPLRPDFMEDHLRELQALLHAPLARRQREATGAATLGAAALALDGRALWNETEGALDAVAAAVRTAFEAHVRRLAVERKLAWRQAVRFLPSQEEEGGFRERLGRALVPLQRVSQALAELSYKVREAEAVGGPELEALHTRWLEILAAFDRAFAQIWIPLATATLRWWEEALWPRLRKLASEKPRRGPSWLRFLDR